MNYTLIPPEQRTGLRCHECGETRSVKYRVKVHNPVISDGESEIFVCNKCVVYFMENDKKKNQTPG